MQTAPLWPHAPPAEHLVLNNCMCPAPAAGYAAQSLLAAIGCVQFVSNVIFASWVLKEQVCNAAALCWAHGVQHNPAACQAL